MRPPCTAKVIDVQNLTYDVKAIRLALVDPPEIHFLAGQYITIEVTEYRNGQPRQNNRPYSIASSPEESGILRLCVNRVGEGPGSTYLHALKPNDILQFSPPLGYFTLNEDETTSLLFVATGTGIAPIQSMIHHIFNRHQGLSEQDAAPPRPMTLYWGLRREDDLYYQETFEQWARAYPFFTFKTTLSRPSAQWSGMRGRVTEHLPHAVIEEVNALDAYLCGNGDMIKEVRSILLERGVPKKRIHFEKFY